MLEEKDKRDYQRDLDKFIAEIPPIGQQINSGTPCPPPYSDQLKADLKDPSKAGELAAKWPTDKRFLKYTDNTHLGLIRSWAGGGGDKKRTTCNEFVGKCGNAMGAKVNLGRFDLDEYLRNNNKRHAWVPAGTGRKPGYGDLFRRSDRLHMGLSLGFDNSNNWQIIESGQGGSTTGCDVIIRRSVPYDPGVILGWCDMRLFLDERSAVPDWLIGLWVIYCGDKTYHYQFNEYHEAFYYPWEPIGGTQNAKPTDTGVVAFQDPDNFTVTWSQEGGVEKFRYDRFEGFPGIMEKMTGTSSKGEVLKGIRM